MHNYTEIKGFSLLHKNLGGYHDFFAACTGTNCTEDVKSPALSELLPGINFRRLPKAGKIALYAAALALEDAGIKLPLEEGLSQKMGIYLASAHGSVGSSFAFNDSILEDGPECASPTNFSYSVNNIYAGLLSIYLNIQGPLCSSSQFLSSAAGALLAASTALLSREVDYALFGVVEETHPLLDAVYAAGADKENPLGEFVKTSAEECAVFFCLQRQTEQSKLLISIPAWREQEHSLQKVDLCLKSGALQDNMSKDSPLQHRKQFYGNTAAVHALDIALAAGLLHQNTLSAYSGIKKITCEILDPLTNFFAGVTLIKASNNLNGSLNKYENDSPQK